MSDWTWRFIEYCWVAWIVYWLIMAFSSKPTIERKGFLGYRLAALAVVGSFLLARLLTHASVASRLWQTTLALGIATDVLVLAGAAFTVWARVTLGRNWSAEVTFKQDHELIQSGPYALARHPIYTGLVAMALGTAINYGRLIGFVYFVALCVAIWVKARQEEEMMVKHFPDAYAAYRSRVHAIIPFVL